MPNRYKRAPRISGGRSYGTFNAGYAIRRAVIAGSIDFVKKTTNESDRLDIIAGEYYGDGTLWWVIAASSGIGWGLQVPAGIELIVPTDIGQIEALIG
jgi:hypothetical protein